MHEWAVGLEALGVQGYESWYCPIAISNTILLPLTAGLAACRFIFYYIIIPKTIYIYYY